MTVDGKCLANIASWDSALGIGLLLLPLLLLLLLLWHFGRIIDRIFCFSVQSSHTLVSRSVSRPSLSPGIVRVLWKKKKSEILHDTW